MERELGVVVLMLDAIEGVFGAACRLPEFDVVLINRRAIPRRRCFDLTPQAVSSSELGRDAGRAHRGGRAGAPHLYRLVSLRLTCSSCRLCRVEGFPRSGELRTATRLERP